MSEWNEDTQRALKAYLRGRVDEAIHRVARTIEDGGYDKPSKLVDIVVVEDLKEELDRAFA